MSVPASVAEPEPTASLLTPIAWREGRIELGVGADRLVAVIDGEPIPLRAGQVVARDPSLAIGLRADKQFFTSRHELLAYGGRLGVDAQVVYAERFETAGPAIFAYAGGPDAWVARELPSRGGELRIQTHHAAIVTIGDAVLGLRRHVIRSEVWDYGDADDPNVAAQLRRLGREFKRLPRGLELLAGELDPMPELPAGYDARDVVATASGELLALGFRHKLEFDGDDGPVQLLSWAAGEPTATITELPGLVDPSAHELGIWAVADTVLIGGLRDLSGPDDQPYLLRRDADANLIEIELPTEVRERVASATITPTGELWMVTGTQNYASEQPCACLWRRPTGDGSTWELVEPTPIELEPSSRWAHVWTEQAWIPVPPGPTSLRHPAAREVVASGGAVWVIAELGPSYPTAEFVHADPRTVLLASVPVERMVELIATDRLFDERVDREALAHQFTPGADECRTFTMVLADPFAVDGKLPAGLDQLADVSTIERDDGWASASVVFVGSLAGPGTLAGKTQLVVEASAWNPKSADTLADAFAQVLGRRPTLDCRPRELIEAVAWLR